MSETFTSKPVFIYRPKPGGSPSFHEIIGRDELIDSLWEALDSQSLRLLAARRMGKTWVCHRMRDSPQGDFKATCYADCEDVTGCSDFARRTQQVAEEGLQNGLALAVERALKAKENKLAKRLKRISFAGFSVELDDSTTWRKDLRIVLNWIDKQVGKIDEQARMLIIWDELPLFIENLAKKNFDQDAWDLLLALKAYRQEKPESRLRMMYTGSIGLPGVIERLHEKGHRGKPISDLRPEGIPLLSSEGAFDLANSLLWSLEQIEAQKESFVRHVAEVCEHHPCMIQFVVDDFIKNPPARNFPLQCAEAALERVVSDPQNTFDLRHYITRLDDLPWRAEAKAILDEVAKAGTLGVTKSQLKNLLGNDDLPELIVRLDVLHREGYIKIRDDKYFFQLGFVALYWCNQRGLE